MKPDRIFVNKNIKKGNFWFWREQFTPRIHDSLAFDAGDVEIVAVFNVKYKTKWQVVKNYLFKKT
jgi:hypothetical protein